MLELILWGLWETFFKSNEHFGVLNVCIVLPNKDHTNQGIGWFIGWDFQKTSRHFPAWKLNPWKQISHESWGFKQIETVEIVVKHSNHATCHTVSLNEQWAVFNDVCNFLASNFKIKFNWFQRFLLNLTFAVSKSFRTWNHYMNKHNYNKWKHDITKTTRIIFCLFVNLTKHMIHAKILDLPMLLIFLSILAPPHLSILAMIALRHPHTWTKHLQDLTYCCPPTSWSTLQEAESLSSDREEYPIGMDSILFLWDGFWQLKAALSIWHIR